MSDVIFGWCSVLEVLVLHLGLYLLLSSGAFLRRASFERCGTIWSRHQRSIGGLSDVIFRLVVSVLGVVGAIFRFIPTILERVVTEGHHNSDKELWAIDYGRS